MRCGVINAAILVLMVACGAVAEQAQKLVGTLMEDD